MVTYWVLHRLRMSSSLKEEKFSIYWWLIESVLKLKMTFWSTNLFKFNFLCWFFFYHALNNQIVLSNVSFVSGRIKSLPFCSTFEKKWSTRMLCLLYSSANEAVKRLTKMKLMSGKGKRRHHRLNYWMNLDLIISRTWKILQCFSNGILLGRWS